jgi:2',3'-cyclic-nucleotide 2'-phosphodiesterase (5'-nucleotidase family)
MSESSQQQTLIQNVNEDREDIEFISPYTIFNECGYTIEIIPLVKEKRNPKSSQALD